MKIKNPLMFLLVLAGNLLMSSLMAQATGLPEPVTFLLLSGTAFLPKPTRQDIIVMAIQKELWLNYIEPNLYKSNAHLLNCLRDDGEVLAGRIVHIPQAGARPQTFKNNAVFPLAVLQRADGDIIYPIDKYTTQPVVITDAEEKEISYNKIDSVIGEHVMAIAELIGDNVLIDWVSAFAAGGVGSPSLPIAAARVIRTAGAATAAHLPGTTGTRLRFTYRDLLNAQKEMNKTNVLREERYALFSPDMLQQLMDDAALIQRDYAKEVDYVNGVIARFAGFNIIERSNTLVYDASATPVVKPLAALAAATDNDSVICWQKRMVRYAQGEIKFFEQLDSPQFTGDIYNVEVRAGGRKSRTNAEGIIAIVQA
jgi:hypothetical protein